MLSRKIKLTQLSAEGHVFSPNIGDTYHTTGVKKYTKVNFYLQVGTIFDDYIQKRNKMSNKSNVSWLIDVFSHRQQPHCKRVKSQRMTFMRTLK